MGSSSFSPLGKDDALNIGEKVNKDYNDAPLLQSSGALCKTKINSYSLIPSSLPLFFFFFFLWGGVGGRGGIE